MLCQESIIPPELKLGKPEAGKDWTVPESDKYVTRNGPEITKALETKIAHCEKEGNEIDALYWQDELDGWNKFTANLHITADKMRNAAKQTT